MPGASWDHSGDVPPVDIVIMAKAFTRAKSRLSGLPPQLHVRFCAALLHDTLDAVHEVAERIAVVSDQPDLDAILVRWGHRDVWTVGDPGDGLNAAVRAGDQFLGPAPYPRPRLAMVADLPCLRPVDIAAIAGEVAQCRAGFVPDASGSGTTILGSATGPLQPHFGPDSARRHRAAGARVMVSAGPGARLDVDTLADVGTAARSGPGRATGDLLPAVERALRGRASSYGSDMTGGVRNDPDPSRCA